MDIKSKQKLSNKILSILNDCIEEDYTYDESWGDERLTTDFDLDRAMAQINKFIETEL